jgi:ribulose-phosphate 3-epimerase
MKKIQKEFIPSKPFKDYAELEELAMKVDGKVSRIQIDVCDGKFVPSVSWPFTEYGKGDFEKLGKKDDFDVYLPLWDSLNYTVDLMCENPQKYIETFVAYGIDEIIVHFRSIENDLGVWKEIMEKVLKYELKIYLAADVRTDFNKFMEFAKESKQNLEGFQVMGIEKIGFQGQDFDQRSLDIVKNLKKNFKDKKVLFDGAIHEETIEDISKAGVDVFCVGSELTNAPDFSDELKVLKSLI